MTHKSSVSSDNQKDQSNNHGIRSLEGEHGLVYQ